MKIYKSNSCIVCGGEDAFVCDDKGYSALDPVLSTEFFLEGDETKVFYCNKCAVTHLFPIIDAQVGNTVDQIVTDIKEVGDW